MSYRRTVGDKIRELRERSGLSTLELGNLLNKSDNTIRHWESNRKVPNTESLVELSKRFNVSIDELLNTRYYESHSDQPTSVRSENEQHSYDTELLASQITDLDKGTRRLLRNLIEALPRQNKKPLTEALSNTGAYIDHFFVSTNNNWEIDNDYETKQLLLTDETPRGAKFAVTIVNDAIDNYGIRDKIFYVTPISSTKMGDNVLIEKDGNIVIVAISFLQNDAIYIHHIGSEFNIPIPMEEFHTMCLGKLNGFKIPSNQHG